MIFIASLFLPAIICMSHQVNQNNLIQTSTKDLKGDMEAEVGRIQTSLKIQDAFLVKLLTNKTEETDETIKDYMKHMDTVLDKMAYIQDYKMEKINTRVNEHIYQTEAYSLIIIMDQLDKKHKEIEQLNLQIQELNRTILSESDKCNDKFTCFDCLQDEECGWCSMDDKCVEGDDKGPLHISCNFYNYKQCNGRQCHKYQTCALCISDPSCGWCQDDYRYISGCIQQPYNYQGCPKGGWYHTEAKSNRCPTKLIRAYEEEFDENSYWSKPSDSSSSNGQAPEDTAEDDKRNALQERGAETQSESKIEYSKKQQAILKQIEDLKKEIKIIEKEIKKLEKKLEEIKKWLKKFQEKNGMEEAEDEEDQENGDEKDEKQEKENDSKEQKDSKSSNKKNDPKAKKELADSKANKDSKDPKDNKDSKNDKKQSKETKDSKESKESKESKDGNKNKDPIDKKENVDKDSKKKDKNSENQNSKDSKDLQKDQKDKNDQNGSSENVDKDKMSNEQNDEDNSNDEKLSQDSNKNENNEESESKQEKNIDKKSNSKKSGNAEQKGKINEKESKNENSKNENSENDKNDDEQPPDLPDRYFKEDELENKRFEDIYHGNYEAKIADDDEINFDHYNDEDYFDDFNNYNY